MANRRSQTSKAMFSPSRSQSSHSTSHCACRACSCRLRSIGFLSCSQRAGAQVNSLIAGHGTCRRCTCK